MVYSELFDNCQRRSGTGSFSGSSKCSRARTGPEIQRPVSGGSPGVLEIVRETKPDLPDYWARSDRRRPLAAPHQRLGAAVATTPSTSSSPEPIMKSTWMALRLPPACSNSLVGHGVGAGERELVRRPQRDVAGGVLVEERVVEQTARLRDRRAVRDQRDLAEPSRRGVGVDQLPQHRFAALRL